MASKLIWLVSLFGLCSLGIALVRQILSRERELRRFTESNLRWWHFVSNDVRRLARVRAAQRTRHQVRKRGIEAIERRMIASGLETSDSRERFQLTHELLLIMSVLLGVLLLARYEVHIALMWGGVLALVGWYAPIFWLEGRRRERERSLEREMPFILAILRIGCSVGREPMRVLDRLTDIIGEEAERHPLAHELKRAQWLARVGSSWEQGLETTSNVVTNQSVARSLEGLRRALLYDGAKLEMIGALADESHETYRIAIERRAAKVPIQLGALILVVILGCSCVFGIRF